MSVQAFYDFVQNNPEVNAKLQEEVKAAGGSQDAFIDKAVQIGQENGYSFSRQDVESFLQQQQSEAGAELSDRELETVAGGRASGFTICVTSRKCWGSVC